LISDLGQRVRPAIPGVKTEVTTAAASVIDPLAFVFPDLRVGVNFVRFVVSNAAA
jgi:hypothetical protein